VVIGGKTARLHHTFNDPVAVEGSEGKQLGEFRAVGANCGPT